MVLDDGEFPGEAGRIGIPVFEELYQTYRTAVFSFAFYLTHNPGEAEDLFQETWLRVVKNRDKIDTRQNMKAWIFTITANLHRDMLRKKRLRRLFRLQKYSASIQKDGIFRLLEGRKNSDPAGALAHKDMAKALAGAITSLPDRQRSVFVLREIEGFQYSEISAIMGLPPGTLKSLMHRAVKRLQKELSFFWP